MTAKTYEEAYAQLSAPVPQDQIKNFPNGGRYTTDKFVQDRLDKVVGPGNWLGKPLNVVLYNQHIQTHNRQGEVTHTFIGIMFYSLTVLGVEKVDVTDLEVDDFMYGSPSTNAIASAFKRAARLHGVARELWAGTEASGTVSGATAPRSNATTAAKPIAGVKQSTADPRPFRTPPDSVIKWLTDLHVPEMVARGLNGAGSRDEPSQASHVITVLTAARKQDYNAYNADPEPHVTDALAMHAPDLLENETPPPAKTPVAAGTRRKPVRRDEEEDDE